MRYVPNLIPEKNKVLKDYFKGSIYEARKGNDLFLVLGWISGIICLLISLISINHFFLMMLYGLAGLILIPPGHNLIERIFRFRFTTKIKSVFSAALLLFIIPATGHYGEIDRKEAQQEQLNSKVLASVNAVKEEQAIKKKNEADKIRIQREDSLNFYINASVHFATNHKIAEATQELTKALSFISTDSDKQTILNVSNQIRSVKATDLIKAGKYKQALSELNKLIEHGKGDSKVFYNRAICFSKTGKIEEAVNDCREAIKYGSTEAEKLYDKINPVRRHIIDYVTRCCDGTTSNAKGRGACSHHDGVCDWNEPVYEESRKY